MPKTRIQIEEWAHQVIARVRAGQPIEDDLVEAKATWIDAREAARLIAGHANAARSTPILWLIGVDEKKCSVPGVERKELAAWYDGVKSHFDQNFAPEPYVVNVPEDGVTVVALYFETDQAPYVVKNPEGQHIDREVPWRSHTRLRSANRLDLLGMLLPAQQLPEIELMSGNLSEYHPQLARETLRLNVSLTLYIVPPAAGRIVIPFHRSQVEINYSNDKPPLVIKAIRMNKKEDGWAPYIVTRNVPPPPDLTTQTFIVTSSEVVIREPTTFEIQGDVEIDLSEGDIPQRVTITIRLYVIDAHMSVVHKAEVIEATPEPGSNILRLWVLPAQ